jgi:hypothetical protein
MHRAARRAGYPSDSSRAAQHQTWTRSAGGGPWLSDYVAVRLRHIRHRPGRSAASWCRPPRTTSVPARAETHRHRPWPPQRPSAVPHTHRRRPPLRSGRGNPPATTLPWGGEPSSPTTLGRRSEPGPVPRGPLPVRGVLDTLRSAGAVARGMAECSPASRPPHGRRQGDGLPDCNVTASPSRGRARGPDVGGGGSAGAVAP